MLGLPQHGQPRFAAVGSGGLDLYRYSSAPTLASVVLRQCNHLLAICLFFSGSRLCVIKWV